MRNVPAELATKLIAAADQLGTTFDDVRMDDIAHASGVPRATLYYYFAGKDDILGFLLDASLAEVREKVQAAGGDDTRSRLTNLIRCQLEHVAAWPATAQLIMLNLGKAGKLVDMRAAADEAYLTPIRETLEEGIRRHEVKRMDVDTCAIALSGALYTMGMSAIITGGPIDSSRLADDVVGLFWNGIERK